MRAWALLTLGGAALSIAKDVQNCSCGFLDSSNGQVYTDATVVYFNETAELSPDFYAQTFAHKKEYGWNTIFRSGALPQNVVIGNSSLAVSDSDWNSSSAQLFIDPSTESHLVNGGSFESMRQDMRYGSFRAFMRGAPSGVGGSAMSMLMLQNHSSSIEIDLLNTDSNSTARITTLVNGEYPGEDVSVNYTTLATGTPGHAAINPWEFVEIRVDWTKRYINYTVAQNMTRSVHKKSEIPSEPLPLAFRLWSTGDANFMQGPPIERSEANVAWIRSFFNSSLATKTMQQDFDSRCKAELKCSIDDTTLRGSTSYPPEALIPWKEPPQKETWRVPVAASSGAAAAIGLICLINVFFRRKPWKTMFNGEKRYEPAELDLGAGLTSPYTKRKINAVDIKKDETELSRSASSSSLESDHKYSNIVTDSFSPTTEENDVLAEADPDKGLRRRSVFKGQRYESIPGTGDEYQKKRASVTFQDTGIFQTDFTFGSPRGRNSSFPNPAGYDFAANIPGNIPDRRSRQMSLFAQSRAMSTATSRSFGGEGGARQRQTSVFQSVVSGVSRLASIGPEITEVPNEAFTNEHLGEEHNIDMKEWNTQQHHDVSTVDPPFNALDANRRPTMAEAVPAAAVDLPLPKAKAGERRVNYLAGLVSFACLGVTAIHFCLTFVPVAGGLNGYTHYRSEYWARWTVEPFLMNPIWLGPLFVTSCRFLVGGFFKHGNLKEIAEKMLLRAPRMLIPVIIVALLEYFFLELGLMDWLLYLPSISWSSWPYIIDYKNWAQFLNDIIELGYLIPNAAPKIVEHYCVGVLWTVPVQLQFSYTALLGAVIVRDIKTPYKRFFVYGVAIVTNWYALSWGACFWGGVMLADLQVTYKVSKWLQANPRVWYPTAILLWCVAISCPVMALLEDRLNYPVLKDEHDIHPDETTGLPIARTDRAGYPLYFEPRLNTLIFACSIQFLLETSKWFQAFFSLGFWQPVFPHAYTIYLIHGFIWWSIGSFMVVKLASIGVPYWGNLLLTATISYTFLALVTFALSPLTEMANAAACRNIQRWGTVPPVPARTTLAPFPRDLFLSRDPEYVNETQAGDVERAMVPTADEDARADIENFVRVEEESEKKRRATLVTINEVESSKNSTHGSSNDSSNMSSSSSSSSR